jgi:hypothetical protein
MKFNSKTFHIKLLSSQNRKVSVIRFMYNKVHHIKFIIIIVVL